VIDLHLHTTASDGQLSPRDLVHAAAAAGVRVLAVTDHDTLAGLDAAETAAHDADLVFVRGIEITAIHEGRDMHMLGYFVDAPDEAFNAFLADQRSDRRRRAAEMIDRLAASGVPIDGQRVLSGGDQARHAGEGFAVGRPVLARALVQAGHVRTVADAFDIYLGEGRPAYVPRRGASPGDVIASLIRIGAVAAVAHPGKMKRDDLIPDFVRAGMAGIEVFHPDHEPADIARYRDLSQQLALLPTGGSDYHGPDGGRARGLGRIGAPQAAFDDLVAHVSRLRSGRAPAS
jgi:predicted metal-dependent phosphoesterase TrpH